MEQASPPGLAPLREVAIGVNGIITSEKLGFTLSIVGKMRVTNSLFQIFYKYLMLKKSNRRRGRSVPLFLEQTMDPISGECRRFPGGFR